MISLNGRIKILKENGKKSIFFLPYKVTVRKKTWIDYISFSNIYIYIYFGYSVTNTTLQKQNYLILKGLKWNYSLILIVFEDISNIFFLKLNDVWLFDIYKSWVKG